MPTKVKSRLTVVGRVYHQQYGKSPSEIESRFDRELESREQVYTRCLEATEGWQRLDCGWLGRVGMLVIRNEEGKLQGQNPTDAELERAARKVLEVTYSRGPLKGNRNDTNRLCWLIMPGESMRALPTHPTKLYVRCQSGTAEYTVFLVPQ